jgi:hypothetical protein
MESINFIEKKKKRTMNGLWILSWDPTSMGQQRDDHFFFPANKSYIITWSL